MKNQNKLIGTDCVIATGALGIPVGNVEINFNDLKKRWDNRSISDLEDEIHKAMNDQDMPSFQDWVSEQQKASYWINEARDIIYPEPDTIDIDHEVIEPKQLKGHEKNNADKTTDQD